jgi:hypothetical protein
MGETGESYMAALRQVLANKPEPAIETIEMIDGGEIADELDIRCRVSVHPALAGLTTRALEHLVRVLRASPDDSKLELMQRAVLGGEHVEVDLQYSLSDGLEFLRRARAGLGGISAGGTMLAAHIDNRMVLFTLWVMPKANPCSRAPTLIVTLPDGMLWGLP